MIQDRNKQHLPGSDAADARGNLKSFPFGRRDFQGSFFQSCLTDKSLPKSKRSGVGRAMQSECANAVDAQPRIVREIKGRIEIGRASCRERVWIREGERTRKKRG